MQYPIRLSDGSVASFWIQVYAAVAEVPWGCVCSYGEIARRAGSPRGARAVGWALHRLPAGTDIPWWRIINARGCISNTSRDHAADEQKTRLEAEGVRFERRDGLWCLSSVENWWNGVAT